MATTLTYTARDIVTAALRKIGAISAGAEPTADEMTDGIMVLNVMLKALQIPSVTVWQMDTGSITLTDATTSYTIASRPYEMGVVNYRTTTDLPMQRLTREEYYELPDKDSAGTPSQFYYRREREQGTLYVWPVLATATGTIEWEGKTEIDDIAAAGDAVDVPAEWYEAVIYQLADRLCDDFEVDAGRQQMIRARGEQALLLAQHSGRESLIFMPDHG